MATFERVQSFLEPDEFAVIDKRWPHWGPAVMPFRTRFLTKASPDEIDQYLYRLPSGEFVLVWHHPPLLPGELVYQGIDAKEAADWFLHQGIDMPDDLHVRLNFVGADESPGIAAPVESAKRHDERRRIPVFDKQGNYVTSFVPNEACCLWESRRRHVGDLCSWHIHYLFRGANGSYIWCNRTTRGKRTKEKPLSAEPVERLSSLHVEPVSAIEGVHRIISLQDIPPGELLRNADADRRGSNQAAEQAQTAGERDGFRHHVPITKDGVVVDALDTIADGVSFVKGELNEEFVKQMSWSPYDCGDRERGNPLDVSFAPLWNWQLFRRGDGSYVYCKWIHRDSYGGYGGRAMSARHAATVLHRTGYILPKVLLSDCKAEAEAEEFLRAAGCIPDNVAVAPPEPADITANAAAEPPTDEAPNAGAALVAVTPAGMAAVQTPAPNEVVPSEDRKQLDVLFGQALRKKVGKQDADKLARRYLFIDKRPWPGVRKLAQAINYHDSRILELPSVQEHKEKHPEQWPASSPKTVGISDANENSISVGGPHEVVNQIIAREEGESETQRLAVQKLAELVRQAEDQAAELRADNADRKFIGKALGRRRKA